MNIIEAIILGIIQGLSEFIPISSTAHLTLAGRLMGLINPQHPEQWTAFIAVIQLGTLAAVLIYFAREIRVIPAAFFRENLGLRKKFSEQSTDSRMGWYIILGSVPIVTIGLALKKIIEGTLTKDPLVIGGSLIGLALLLALAERIAKFRKGMDNISLKDALLIGLAQCVALIPGSSRSGTTITAGLFLGIKREDAARFSFLLSIPAVFGSGLYEFYKSMGFLSGSEFITLAVAVLASAISGYVSIAFLLNYLKKHSTMLFVYYRIILGIIVVIMAVKGLI